MGVCIYMAVIAIAVAVVAGGLALCYRDFVGLWYGLCGLLLHCFAESALCLFCFMLVCDC